MSFEEYNNFISEDKKEYDLKNNAEFVEEFISAKKNGYKTIQDIESLQKLIDEIVNFYEFKYPNRFLKHSLSFENKDYTDCKELVDKLSIRQLFYRIMPYDIAFLNGDYRSLGGTVEIVRDENDKIVGHREVGFLPVYEFSGDAKKKNKQLMVKVDRFGNLVNNFDLEYLTKLKKINTIDNLLNEFNNYHAKKYDYSSVYECVNSHNYDLMFREKIIRYITLKLLYQRSVVPECNYYRAKMFIDDFNKAIPNLNYSDNEITYLYFKEHLVKVRNK